MSTDVENSTLPPTWSRCVWVLMRRTQACRREPLHLRKDGLAATRQFVSPDGDAVSRDEHHRVGAESSQDEQIVLHLVDHEVLKWRRAALRTCCRRLLVVGNPVGQRPTGDEDLQKDDVMSLLPATTNDTNP